MNKAVFLHQTGDESCLKWEDVPLPKLGDGEVVIKHEADMMAINFINSLDELDVE